MCPCADPEHFIREGPTLTTFLEGRDNPNKYPYKWTIIGPPAKRWRADNEWPKLNAGLVAL